MNEAETIEAHILPALKAAGWGAEGCRIRQEYRITEGRIEGQPEEIGKTFAGFQKYLYAETA